MQEAGWTFYGREGCDCCSAAAGLLLHVLGGTRVRLRLVDLRGHPRGAPRAIPAFVDPGGKTVWEGSFDSEATRMALEAWGLMRLPPEGVSAT